MAYRAPAFMFNHPVASIANSAITESPNTTGISDADRRALRDYRQGTVASWQPAVGFLNAGPRFDLGSQPIVTTLVIPAGKVWSSAGNRDLRLISSSSATFAVGNTTHFAITSTDDSLVDQTFTGSTDRYWWLLSGDSASGDTFSISQFWIGQKLTFTAATVVSPDWRIDQVYDYTEEVVGGINRRVELSPIRRRFTLDLGWILPNTPDMLYLDLISAQGLRPFWYWPPDDQFSPALVMLEEQPEIVQDHPSPASSITYACSLSMIEQVG